MNENNPDENFDFDAAYGKIAWAMAEKHGFAVPTPRGVALSVEQRVNRVRGRSDAARTALTDLQQWLLDDDKDVRQQSREAIRSIVCVAYAGDRSDREARNKVRQPLFDRIVARAIARRTDLDSPAPWGRSRVQRRVRFALITAALGLSIAAALFIGLQHPAAAAPLVVGAAVLDILDGAFARATHMRDARLRWHSCVNSQLGDMVMLVSIAIASMTAGETGAWASLMAAAILMSLFGSFVRTSALQAGYRFWRSALERWLRYISILIYCACAAAGHNDAGVSIAAATVGVFGAWEILRVVISVGRMVPVETAGMVFVDTDSVVHGWGLSDDEDADETWSYTYQPGADRLLEKAAAG
jgi:hypothetical protein